MNVNYVYAARVVRIIDGDTVQLVIDMGFSTHRNETMRLAGINAPEPRGESREAGLAASEWLFAAAPPGSMVTVQTVKVNDKYGRYVGWLFDAMGRNLNVEMVNAGHAVFASY